MQTTRSRVASSIEVTPAGDAAAGAVARRPRQPPGPNAYAAALSILLHVVFLVMLYRLDLRPGELRRGLAQGSEAVLIVQWVENPKEIRRVPDAVAEPEAISIAARVDPPQSSITDLTEPAPEQAPAIASNTAEPSAPTPPEASLDASIAALVPASFADGLLPTPAPPLEDLMPETRKVSIEREQQTMLVERVTDLARTLQDGQPAEFAWEHRGRPFRAVLTPKSAMDSTDFDSVLVEITAKGRNGASQETQLTLRRLAFSQFTQVVDRWDPNVQMHDDQIVGRFHSNSKFQVLYDSRAAPSISGMATTAGGDVDVDTLGSRQRREGEVFQGGVQVRAKRIALPDKARRYLAEALDAEADVHRFSEDTHLVLHADGHFTWLTSKAELAAQGEYAQDRPVYFIAGPGAALYVKGVVNGKVLIYAPEHIVIEGHLRYADDPRVSPHADDYLGIVSDKYVEIARPGVTGPGDLNIDAAIFARRGFYIENIDIARAGTLSIYGSLTCGTISASEPRYATKVEFDPRLDQARPPGFPATNHYELDSWDTEWSEFEDDDPADTYSASSTPSM